MAVDRGYGSGKPLSAAQSRNRRRVASGQMTKGKKGTSATLRKIAKENPVTGFIGGGILPAKLLKAASSLRAAGMVRPYSVANRVAKEGLAEQFFGRAVTKLEGRSIAKEIAKRNSVGRSTELPMAAIKGAKVARSSSESVFPRLPNANIPGSRRSFDIYEDPLLEGAYRFSGGVKPGRKLSGNPTVNVSIAELPKTKLPKRGR